MVDNPPKNMPRITPALAYDDPKAALEWLQEAFGFKVRFAVPGPDGGIVHSEVEVADGLIMVGPSGGMDSWSSPKSLDGKTTQSCYVFVDDVDAHYAHAKESGAGIVEELTDQFYGARTYRARDPEGHLWVFAQQVKDVSFDDFQ